MTNIGKKDICVAIYTAEIPSWADEILIHLTAQGYTLSRLDGTGGSLFATEKPVPDAIITLYATDGLRLAQELGNGLIADYRPLLVHITNSPDYSPNEWADVILPPIPRFIEQQLRTLLRLREENALLRQKVLCLENNMAEVSEALERQKRLSTEVEILRNAIVRNVSHELKTPLLQVKSAVALIAEGIEDEELVKYAKESTGRLETLVKNITLLGSSLDINPGPVIVRDAVEYAKRNLRRIWEHRYDVARVQTYYDPHLPPVLADKQGLSTVLQLLIDNALKFSQGVVEVLAHQTDDGVQISIKDYGIGIAPNQLNSIFELFYQGDSSSTRRYGGTGIGLAIVQLILDHHKAWIDVESQIGAGSTFSFLLPIVEM